MTRSTLSSIIYSLRDEDTKEEDSWVDKEHKGSRASEEGRAKAAPKKEKAPERPAAKPETPKVKKAPVEIAKEPAKAKQVA